MKAILYDKKHPDKLILRNIDTPTIKDDEVLIKVVTSSINAADYRSMKMGMIPKSKIFGSAVAGFIETVGNKVSKFKPGDEVIGDITGEGFGGLAEYVAAPEKVLTLKPANISFEDAASLPIAAITALQGLRDKGNIQKGQKVLIVGSGGGVGTFAVQLAKYYEAEVTAVCRTKNVEQSKQLGADNVIDYTKENFTKSNKKYDLILAINGNYSLLACKKRLNNNGKYVMIGGSMKQIFTALLLGKILSLGNKKILALSAKPIPEDLGFTAQLIEEGKLKSVIEKTYSLEETADAMKYLLQGHAKGKVIINIG